MTGETSLPFRTKLDPPVGGQGRSHLKGWARGVYHGLRRKHLQAYLDEFVFRFNRRKTRHAAFRSLFSLAVQAKPITYNMLIKPEASA